MIISDHMSRFMLFSWFFLKHITFLTSETHIKVNTARAGLWIFSYLTNYQYLMTEKSNISSDCFFFYVLLFMSPCQDNTTMQFKNNLVLWSHVCGISTWCWPNYSASMLLKWLKGVSPKSAIILFKYQ